MSHFTVGSKARVFALFFAAFLAVNIHVGRADCESRIVEEANEDLKIKTLAGSELKKFTEGSSKEMEEEDFYLEPETWCQNQCENESECKGYAFLAISGGKTTCTLYGAVTSDQSTAKCRSFKCNSTFGFCNGGAVTKGDSPSPSPDSPSPSPDAPRPPAPTPSGAVSYSMGVVAAGIVLLA